MPVRVRVSSVAATGTGRGAGASWLSRRVVATLAFPWPGRPYLDWNCWVAASVCGPNIPS